MVEEEYIFQSEETRLILVHGEKEGLSRLQRLTELRKDKQKDRSHRALATEAAIQKPCQASFSIAPRGTE